MKPRTVFMGSPEFAVPALQALAAEYPVVGVVTQPDRPAGRGRELNPPAVKIAAQALGIAVIQPARLRAPEAMEALRAWSPELIVVAAYGQILRPAALELPEFGCVNVHASLLPRWRGAAPINAAILHGDAQSGVTIMRMDAGMDTGPMLAQRALPIEPGDTAQSLGVKLSALGAQLLLETLPAYLDGSLAAQAQDSSLATLAPMLKKEDGALDFTRTAEELARQVRAYDPWPGSVLSWEGGPLKVLRAQARPAAGDGLLPGMRIVCDGLPAVRAADGLLLLEEVQPAGKKPMSGKSFLQGARGWETGRPV
jgi:methionyl-tRNA formyltransferase